MTPATEPVEFEYVRPWLYDAQRIALFDCPDVNGQMARYGVCEASTKAGKTAGCILWLSEQALVGPGNGREYWWVAPVYGQAKIAYRRMKRSLPRAIYKANDSDLSITLWQGAVLRFKSAEKPDNLYGEDVWAAVLDEASRMREESWQAVRSTLTATRGPIRVIGNVKGRRNWFYKMARKGEQGTPGYAYRKLTAYDAVAGGVLAAAEIEDAKEALPEDVFNELYLAEPSDDGGNPFGIKHIEACIRPGFSEEKTVCFGVDLAKRRDWTVIIGLDRFGQVTGFERWQKKPWKFTTARISKIVGRLPALIDATGVGDPIVENLMGTNSRVEGLVFTPKSKQMLMEGLAVAIQSQEVGYPDGTIRDELDEFEFVNTLRGGVTYSAPAGYHDDCVMALALAKEQHRRLYPTFQRAVAPAAMPRISPWVGATSGGYDGDQGHDDDHELDGLGGDRFG